MEDVFEEGSDTSLPSLFQVEDENGPLVEVTLQSLKGIHFRRQPRQQQDDNNGEEEEDLASTYLPNITAAVAFSGSAAEMEVSSSFICSKSGNLMSESLVATPAKSETGIVRQDGSGENEKVPLITRWNECGDEALLTEDFQPHLSIRVPQRDPRVPTMPISQLNRDSSVIKDSSPTSRSRRPPSLDESECSSILEDMPAVSAVRASPSYDDYMYSEANGGTSVVWSASGAAMPEIIELYVNLKIEQDDNSCPRQEMNESESSLWTDSMFEIGVAHLVFFGNDEGTTIMDLPIKRKRTQKNLGNDRIVIDDSVRLRIKVNVLPKGRVTTPTSPERRHYSQSILEETKQAIHRKVVLEPILLQLREAENQLAEKMKKARRDGPKHFASNRLLCGVLDSLAAFQESVQCNLTGPAARTIPRQDSMASTIDTAASLHI
mmetsp:Transcript_38041/g.56594  ORF Transcript_38041/g.56594 Transcript_38041/m.56594 type:complete len:435 (-) Transcript_38041:279-1583(-)|eukprot:CAMPEP_0194048802 /NCGR_PEP_ID=MMETSP0009_2-20130614/28581_1 /TAXON_ID=210454 /ORGANISM="Grammatophora oceanica, Strain CCMP 410" /LENGTH=434 /DNA_ID=CAMNT_0038694787 /DNA_START=179 /DNA_END=1483 /DNA_ORIENTATION=+